MDNMMRRIEHDARVRQLTVRDVVEMFPGRVRVTLGGEDLHDFVTVAPDDAVELFVPGDNGEIAARAYTVRRFDADKLTLDVGFALASSGPADRWASSAEVGDDIEIGGPTHSDVLTSIPDWLLLIGDETALAAISRTAEMLGRGTRTTAIVAADRGSERYPLGDGGELNVVRAYRPYSESVSPDALLAAFERLAPPAGSGFVWIAAERDVAEVLGARARVAWSLASEQIAIHHYWIMNEAVQR